MNKLFSKKVCVLLLLCLVGVTAFAQKGYKKAYTLFDGIIHKSVDFIDE